MTLEIVGCDRNLDEIRQKCRSCLSYHATLMMDDGSTLDGIIEDIHGDNVTLLVGEDVMVDEDGSSMTRQRPMGFMPGRFRRFRRRGFPMHRINMIRPVRYPFIYPIYPYPYPYPYPYYPY